MIYGSLIRPILFRCDPESAHRVALRTLALAGPLLPLGVHVRDPAELMGLHFPNRVGLAAGFDKNAEATQAWAKLGFGFAELGTVTPRPQAGNPRPRMFRLPVRRAVVNRMGFNNDGAEAVRDRLAKQGPARIPVGISIGKNKDTPDERAPDDYAAAARLLAPFAGYLAVNVSSPNTPGLRALQAAPALGAIVAAVRAETPKPILVKVAPELGREDLEPMVEAAMGAGAAGFIATNTLSTAAMEGVERGGMSGEPLREIALWRVAELRALLPRPAVVVGCGGVACREHAEAMRAAGADLVQLYTALVYEGPFLPRRM